jgi:hypothetical protein
VRWYSSTSDHGPPAIDISLRHVGVIGVGQIPHEAQTGGLIAEASRRSDDPLRCVRASHPRARSCPASGPDIRRPRVPARDPVELHYQEEAAIARELILLEVATIHRPPWMVRAGRTHAPPSSRAGPIRPRRPFPSRSCRRRTARGSVISGPTSIGLGTRSDPTDGSRFLRRVASTAALSGSRTTDMITSREYSSPSRWHPAGGGMQVEGPPHAAGRERERAGPVSGAGPLLVFASRALPPQMRLRPVDQPELGRSVNWLDSAGRPACGTGRWPCPRGTASSQSPRGSRAVHASWTTSLLSCAHGAAGTGGRQRCWHEP